MHANLLIHFRCRFVLSLGCGRWLRGGWHRLTLRVWTARILRLIDVHETVIDIVINIRQGLLLLDSFRFSRGLHGSLSSLWGFRRLLRSLWFKKRFRLVYFMNTFLPTGFFFTGAKSSEPYSDALTSSMSKFSSDELMFALRSWGGGLWRGRELWCDGSSSRSNATRRVWVACLTSSAEDSSLGVKIF